MSEDTKVDTTEEELEEDAPPIAPGSHIKAKPVKGDVKVDFTNPERETLKPRISKNQKVFTNGFKIPGFSGYTDVPGKICVDCGWRAMKFSSKCAKCGGELRPE
jgi:hypothetical protein